MMKRVLGTGLAILVTWTAIDGHMHRLLLAPLYETNSGLWRPFDQMNITLIYTVTFALIGVFLSVYCLLVRPKTLGTGLALGTFVGFALGVASGAGTFIHMPIPPALAWGWFFGGLLKGVVAGGIMGAMITED
jgi:hypothetical protein